MPTCPITILYEHPATQHRPAQALPADDREAQGPGAVRPLGMNQQQFEAFMAAQIAAIQASGMEPHAWIERRSNTFRTAWENSHAA